MRDLEELLGSGEFAWVRYLLCACPHSFPTLPSSSPNPSPLCSSPLSSIPPHRAAGRRGQERWRFGRRVLPYLLSAVSELASPVSHPSIKCLLSPDFSIPPLITIRPTTHIPTITFPYIAPHWPSSNPTRFGSRTHRSNPARASRAPVAHVLRPSRSSGFPHPRRSTHATSH